jgi:hypothetical protein
MFRALPLRKPVLQNGQLVRFDARKSDAHPCVGDDRHDTTKRSEGSVSLRDPDPQLGACRRGILRINKTSADTEFAGPAGTLGIRGHIGHFGIRNEQIPWPATAFPIHYHAASQQNFNVHLRKSGDECWAGVLLVSRPEHVCEDNLV